jgi:hypothetical protein
MFKHYFYFVLHLFQIRHIYLILEGKREISDSKKLTIFDLAETFRDDSPCKFKQTVEQLFFFGGPGFGYRRPSKINKIEKRIYLYDVFCKN